MSVWYSAEGEIKVRACEEVKKIVNENLDRGELYAEYEDNGDGTATVFVQGGAVVSNSSPEVFEGWLKELGKYAIEPSIVQTDMDGETCDVYVGPPKLEAASTSAHILKEIEVLLKHLTPDDRVKLKEML